jgi:DNA-binding XRE family transcriptional regulator
MPLLFLTGLVPLDFYTLPCIILLMAKKKKVQWDKEGVKALRQHLGVTQMKMAEQLGTRQQTISEWETGMYQPRGTSATLLSIVAERSGFRYEVKKRHDKPD